MWTDDAAVSTDNIIKTPSKAPVGRRLTRSARKRMVEGKTSPPSSSTPKKAGGGEAFYRERAENTTGLFGPRVLTDDALVAIATHKYVGGSYTPLDLMMNDFWFKCTEYLPLWLAPNMVTLIGVFFNFFGVALLYREQGGQLQGPAAPWVHLTMAFCIFAYQTLDAMDGKHARRTKNSTPLGKLFDHGCDALSSPVLAYASVSAIQMGPSVHSLMGIAISLLPFFMSQWAETHTGVLQHSMGWVGVTETQILCMGFQVVSAFVPPAFWTTPFVEVLGVPLPLNICVVYGLMLPGAAMMCVSQMGPALSADTQKSKVGILSELLALAPFFATVWAFAVHEGSKRVLESNPNLTMATLSLSMVHITTQVIVMNMGHMQFSSFQPTTFLQPLILLAFAYQVVDEACLQQLPLCAAVLAAAPYARWALSATNEICAVLDIHCLRINKPRD